MKKINQLQCVTASTFDSFCNAHIDHDTQTLLGIQKPRNSKEFKLLTSLIYGVTLDVECFVYPQDRNNEYSANYKIAGREEVYSQKGIMPLWEKKFGQYEGLRVLLDWCFGELSCGGVAGTHYGQTKLKNKTDYERIKKWGNQEVNATKHALELHNSLVDTFGRNPFL